MRRATLFRHAVLIFFALLQCSQGCDDFMKQWKNTSCNRYFSSPCYSNRRQKIEISSEVKQVEFKCFGSLPDTDAIKCINATGFQVVIFNDCHLFSFNMKHFLMDVPTEQIHLIYYISSSTVGADFVCDNIVNLKRFVIQGSKNNDVFNHAFKGDMNKFVSLEVTKHGYKKFEQNSFSNLVTLEKLIFRNGVLNEIRTEDFRGLNNLRILDLSNNEINRLDSDIFKELTSLYELHLTGNRITSILSEHFQFAPQLSILRIGSNNIKNPPVNLLQNIASLRELDIHRNRLNMGIEYGFFQGVSKLRTLNVSGCSLRKLDETVIPYAIFNTECNSAASLLSCLFSHIPNKSIETSNQTTSFIQKRPIGSSSFLTRLISLQVLDLSHNLLTKIKRGAFDGLIKLEELYISHNALHSIPPSNPFGPSRVLKILKANNCQLKENINFNFVREHFIHLIDLSHNRFTELTLPINSNKRTRIALNDNDIHTIWIDRRMARCTSKYRNLYDVNNNKFQCKCALREFVNFLREDRHDKVFINGHRLTCIDVQSKVMNVNFGRMNCPLQCFAKCNCMTNFMNCYGLNLTDVPPSIPPGVKTLNFSKNKLKTLSNTNAKYWKDATALYVSQNLLETINDWEFPQNLHLLALNENKLTSLPQSLMKVVNKSRNFSLYLAFNSWKCDCSTLELKEWFMHNINKIKDADKVRCSLYHAGSIVDAQFARVPKEAFCVFSLSAVFYVCFLMIACLILVISTYVYYFRFTVFSLLHSRNLLCSLVSNKGVEMKYDSFLCFSPADQELVDEFVEEMGALYKFCLPDRDWSPKFGIHKNIIHSILNSRTTLLFISRNSVNSLWFMVKFRCAFKQMIEDGMHRLIVFIIGDVGDINGSNYDLQRFIASQPNIKWGEKWYREKLHFSLSYQ